MFCYYAEDTVERNILDLAARSGQSLYTKDNAAGTLTAGPITAPDKHSIDAPRKAKSAQKGDFVFKYVAFEHRTRHFSEHFYRTDDMLAILFPHLFEDIEFLVPWEYSNSQINLHTSAAGSQPTAGPSRLG